MSFRNLWLCLAGLGLIIGVAWFRRGRDGAPEPPPPVSQNPIKPESPSHAAAQQQPQASVEQAETARVVGRLEAARLKLAGSTNLMDCRRFLAVFRAELNSLPPAVASAAIQEFLDSRADAPTQLGFVLDAAGALKEAPTWRVFLLDYWAQTDLEAAAAYAKKILATKDSSDEWAVSMRNYARAKTLPEARSFLSEKVREMITYEPWQQNPSAGFLEAFDVAVHLGGTGLMPPLTELIRKKDNQSIAHAAYLALDRLTIQDAAAVLGQLLKEPDSMQGREITRANYFARADVSNLSQRQLLEDYLLSPRVTPAELNTFAGVFPNANYMISHNLLTKTVTPDRDTLAKQDQAALRVAQEWLADERFEKINPFLLEIQSRLRAFVEAAQPSR